MSIRTIIEINHDHLREAEGVIADLIRALPHSCEREIREELAKSNAVRFIGQRHHSYDMKLVIAQSPYTPLPSPTGDRSAE
jgi:hypothetical protein